MDLWRPSRSDPSLKLFIRRRPDHLSEEERGKFDSIQTSEVLLLWIVKLMFSFGFKPVSNLKVQCGECLVKEDLMCLSSWLVAPSFYKVSCTLGYYKDVECKLIIVITGDTMNVSIAMASNDTHNMTGLKISHFIKNSSDQTTCVITDYKELEKLLVQKVFNPMTSAMIKKINETILNSLSCLSQYQKQSDLNFLNVVLHEAKYKDLTISEINILFLVQLMQDAGFEVVNDRTVITRSIEGRKFNYVLQFHNNYQCKICAYAVLDILFVLIFEYDIQTKTFIPKFDERFKIEADLVSEVPPLHIIKESDIMNKFRNNIVIPLQCAAQCLLGLSYPSICGLPNELLLSIVNYLSVSDVYHCMLSCKSLHERLNDRLFWRMLLIRDSKIIFRIDQTTNDDVDWKNHYKEWIERDLWFL